MANSCGLTTSWDKKTIKQLYKVQHAGGTGLAKTVKWKHKDIKPLFMGNTDTESIVCSSALNRSEAAVGGFT